MAQYKCDFSEMTGGGDDWGGVWEPNWDATTSGEMFIICSGERKEGTGRLYHPVRGHPKRQLWLDGAVVNQPTDRNFALEWTELGDSFDEVEMLSCHGLSTASNEGGGVILRGAGSEASKTGIAITHENIGFGRIYAHEWDAEDYNTIGWFNHDRIISAANYNVMGWLRARVSGEKLWVKYWLGEYEDEPAAWDIDGNTVQKATGTGWVGLYNRTISLANLGVHGSERVVWYDFVSVGTDGDPAPGPDFEPAGAIVTQMLVEVVRPFHAPEAPPSGAGQPVIVIVSS
jgi:hypothetical protein